MPDSLESTNKDSEVQQADGGFWSQYGGLKKPMITVISFIGSIITFIAWVETASNLAKITLGLFIAFTAMSILFFVLSYLEYQGKQNDSFISILPMESSKQFTIENYRVQLPLFDEHRKREILISLHRLAFEAENLLNKYKEDSDYVKFRNKISKWQNEDLESFVSSTFGKDYFRLMNFNQNFEPNSVSRKIEVIRLIINQLENQ